VEAAIDRLMARVPPDNREAPRADARELLRAARGPLWQQVFSTNGHATR
jgi:hypothetical protein